MSDNDAPTVPEHGSVSPVEQEPLQQETKKLANITFSIWPPSQRTRDAVVTRLIETLSTPSVLSKRYGTIPQEEATSEARRIEDEAFGMASGAVSTEEDGLEILQLYSKEISKRMLDAVKARASSTSTVDNGTPSPVGEAAETASEVASNAEKSEVSSN